MQYLSFRTFDGKPILLACAISLALTACGGSGNDNHAAPEQPQTPATPQNTPTPPAADNNPTPQAPQQTPDKPSKPNNNGNNSGGNNSGGNNNTQPPQTPASPQNPKDGPALPKQTTFVPDGKFHGPAFFSPYVNKSKGVILNVFSPTFANTYTPAKNAFGFKPTAINSFLATNPSLGIPNGYKVTAPVTLKHGKQSETVELSKAGETEKFNLKLDYTGESFGYADAQALHFYGKMTDSDGKKNLPFDIAYSVGTMTPVKDIDALQGEIQYKGYASFRAYEKPADKLATGTAALTLDMGKKAITHAAIDMQTSIGKTYTFASADKPISISKNGMATGETNNSFETANFKGAAASQGLRGYFYGKEAKHIGGVYYTEDGGGAFITEKQP